MKAGLASSRQGRRQGSAWRLRRSRHHADAVGIDPPFRCPLADERERRARESAICGARAAIAACGSGRGLLGGGREHLGHRPFEARHVRRGRVQPVLEHEGGHALVGQRKRATSCSPRSPSTGRESAAGGHDDRRPRRLGRIREAKGVSVATGDIAGEDACCTGDARTPGGRRARQGQRPGSSVRSCSRLGPGPGMESRSGRPGAPEAPPAKASARATAPQAGVGSPATIGGVRGTQGFSRRSSCLL